MQVMCGEATPAPLVLQLIEGIFGVRTIAVELPQAENFVAGDIGTLCAPTAFGKTVAAAAMIARRGVSMLILVHRTELLKQWQERLQTFLGAGKDVVGVIGGGKNKPSGKIDIVVMQSLNRKGGQPAGQKLRTDNRR